MSIANRINEITKHLENDYINIEALVGEVSEDKNIENIAPILDTLWEELPKVTGEHTSLNLNNTKKGKTKLTLKGNTYQDGEPTPDAPQEVEVVTGENEVVVEGKNLFNKNSGIDYGKFYTNTGEIGTDNDTFIQTIYISVNSNTRYTISGYYSDYFRICEYDKNKNFIQRDLSDNTTTSFSIITTAQTKYVRISCFDRNLSSLQLEQSSTATTYEAYKGQTYEVNLGKNLFDKDNANYVNLTINTADMRYYNASDNRAKLYYIKCKPNTTYTYSKSLGSFLRICSSPNIPAHTGVISVINSNTTGTSTTITTGANDNYISIYPLLTAEIDTVGYDNVLSTIQIEEGSTATTYAPYFTPIELCKISTYQDRIYKSNGNWYLHKEIGKVVLDGTNVAFTYQDQNVYPNTLMIPYSSRPRGLGDTSSVICSHFSNIATNVGTTLNTLYWSASTQMWICKEGFTSLNNGNTWLQTQYNNGTPVIIYYALQTPTETQITDTTLVNQLEAVWRANSYDNQTNVSQTNSSLPFIISASALEKLSS